MKATVLDLRKNMKNVLAALNRNERVTLTYRGRNKAEIIPCANTREKKSVCEHPAFGMWSNRKDIKNVDAFVRKLRKGRF